MIQIKANSTQKSPLITNRINKVDDAEAYDHISEGVALDQAQKYLD